MPTAKPRRPAAVRRFNRPEVPDPTTERALRNIETALDPVMDSPLASLQLITADLVVGVNKIAHGLGRAPRNVRVTPTTADASWAWAWTTAGNALPQRQVWITTVGVAQAGATIEVY